MGDRLWKYVLWLFLATKETGLLEIRFQEFAFFCPFPTTNTMLITTFVSDEWIYESVDNMAKGWATTQHCDLSSYKRVKTPFDNYVTDATQSGYNLKCYEYTKGCQGRVMRCKYKGPHGEDIPYDAKLSHWYFNGKYEHKEVENETFFIQ